MQNIFCPQSNPIFLPLRKSGKATVTTDWKVGNLCHVATKHLVSMEAFGWTLIP